MKTRNLFVYMLALLITLAFATIAFGQGPDPSATGTELNAENDTTLVTTTETTRTFKASATLTETDTDDPVTDDAITVKFTFKDPDGAEIDYKESGTDENGVAEVTFEAPSSGGDYSFTAYFPSTESSTGVIYEYSQDTAAVNVTKAPTELQVDEKTVTANAPFTDNYFDVSATLSADGTGLDDKQIEFTYDSTSKQATTLSTGFAEFLNAYKIPTVAGTDTYNAKFTSDDTYAGSSGSANLNVGKRATTLELADLPEMLVGNTFDLSATLSDDAKDTGLGDKDVNFSVETKTDQTVSTDPTGTAVTSFTAPEEPGTYDYSAAFDGDGTFMSADSSKQMVVKDTVTVNAVEPPATSVDGTVLAKAEIVDSSEEPVPSGEQVDFTLYDGTTTKDFVSTSTNANGVATADLTAPPTTGDYTYEAYHPETDKYKSGTDTANVTVKETYTLMTTASGDGTVTVTPNQNYYLSGTTVDITATANTGWKFVEWTGDTSTIVDPNSASTIIEMDGDKSITANFEKKSYAVTTAAEPEKGAKFLTGDDTYTYNTTATVNTEPSYGYVFTHWKKEPVGGTTMTSDQNPYSFTVTTTTDMTAFFEKDTYTITPDVTTTGGSISPSSPQSVKYEQSTSFDIIPTTADGYKIAAVTVDGTNVTDELATTDATATYTFDTVTDDHTITAGFELKSHDLALTLTGDGSGSVTISADGTTTTYTSSNPPSGPLTYEYGTKVGLEVNAFSGNEFGGWSGTSSGDLTSTDTNTWSLTVDEEEELAAIFYAITASQDFPAGKWNLMSIPLVPDDPSCDAVIGDDMPKNTCGDFVKTLDAADSYKM